MTGIIITIVVVVILAILIFWGIGVQNKLVKADEISKNALKQINVQQMSRYDAIKALVKLTREYAGHENDTLIKVVEARKITATSRRSRPSRPRSPRSPSSTRSSRPTRHISRRWKTSSPTKRTYASPG